MAVSMLVVVALVGNIAGFPTDNGPPSVAAAWTLACGAMIFVFALDAVQSENVELTADR